MLSLDQIRRALADHRPEVLAPPDAARAAVALVLRQRGAVPELLFIERARRSGDPWSGHMAFPGGRMQAEDASTRHAAERETHEEVGLALDRTRLLGRLDDLPGRHAGRPVPLVISAFVYAFDDAPPPPLLNHEVRAAFWVPVAEILDPHRHIDHTLRREGGLVHYPGIAVGRGEGPVVWGLTYRFLEVLLHVAGRPLPDRWAHLRASEPERAGT